MKYRRKWGKYQQLYFDSIVEKNLRLYYLPFPVFQSIIGQPKFKNIPVPGLDKLRESLGIPNISECLNSGVPWTGIYYNLDKEKKFNYKIVKFKQVKKFYRKNIQMFAGGLGAGKSYMSKYLNEIDRKIMENRDKMMRGDFEMVEDENLELEKDICKNCGEEITYETRDTRYMHKYGRWEGDNGYFCFKDNNKLYAEKAGKINDK